MRGAEKFVLRFPHAVLGAFVRSFSVVQRLAEKTATALMQDFLMEWWPPQLPKAKLDPSSGDEVALMRLVTQAQMPPIQHSVAAAYSNLPSAQRSLLAA